MWVYHNQNPAQRQVNDCVIRAISLAEDRSWDEVYYELSQIAQRECIILDDVDFVEPYLNKKYDKVCYRCKDCKLTLEEFARLNPTGVFLVTMKGHITCVVDGDIYDTWDCTDRFIWCAWKVE